MPVSDYSARARLRRHPGWREAGRTLADVETKVTVWRLIEKAQAQKAYPLSKRELKILLWRHGFVGEEVSLRDTGFAVGISAERTRQVEIRALYKLQRAAGLQRLPGERPLRVDRAWKPDPRRWSRPGSARPLPGTVWDPSWPGPYADAGPLELICDRCRTKWRSGLWHARNGRIPLADIAVVRSLGKWHGWTIDGCDLCPHCSTPAWTVAAEAEKMDRVARPYR